MIHQCHVSHVLQARSCKASMTSMNRTSEICTVPTYWFLRPFTNLPIGICAIYFHLKVPSTKHLFGTGERGWQYHLYIYALSRRYILKEHPAGDFKFYEQEGPFIFTNLTIIWFSNMFEFANHLQDILCPKCSGLYSFVMPKCGHFWRTY